MKVQLKIIMLDPNNNEVSANIGYVNPQATDAQLYELARKFSNLTSNSFIKVEKIITTTLDGE